MKRIISILLLIVLPVMAVKPTLAVHFCGGSFHSAGLGEAGRACCGGMAEDAGGEDAGGGVAVSDYAEPCCSDYTLALSTDTYQLQQTVKAVPLQHVADSLCAVFNPSATSIYALPVPVRQKIFPPGAVHRRAQERLALVCVWRN
ncbi:MAG: hypothetical protein LBJ58_08630 [Tannerellaceae bacterium]|jgi:hypothetical protein|nr:hypothetical protein [Tannerellaceae bacterium]